MKEILEKIVARAKADRQSGFTLIEVLIAISILTVGLLGVASMQISAMRGNYFSDNTTTALVLAEDKMEDLMARDWSDADLNNTQTGNDTDLSSITTVDHEELDVDAMGQVGGGIFRRIWNIDDSNDPTMKTITVIVCWDSNRHRVSLTSCRIP